MAVETVPASAGSKRENRYAFRAKDGGRVYSVPKIEYLSGDSADLIAESLKADSGMDELTLTRRLLIIECPEGADEIRRMAADQIMWLSGKWVAASAITPGESDGSE